jgi:1-acyl-sn-glycerol-3-phosphate acyltransferase
MYSSVAAEKSSAMAAAVGKHNQIQMARPLHVVEDPTPEALAPRLDDFGFDREYTELFKPIAEWLYREYWRVEAFGLKNVPAEGRALLVANHAGVIPWDGAMIRTAIASEHPSPRHARMLVADWAFQMPFLSEFLMKTGNVVAHPQNATTLLERDELVGVFPEGVKGATKLYRERYRVKRFGRGGFIQVAMRTRSPIIPVAVVGSEEVHPVIFELPLLADALGVPAFPITPTWPLLGLLGAIPLPSKWLIAFGEPIDLGAYSPAMASDPALVLELSERVRGAIQAKLFELLPRRQTPFY